MSLETRETVAASPGMFLGRSGRWSYQVVKSSASGYYCYASRSLDGLRVQTYAGNPFSALRAMRRRVRWMERAERSMP